jgi:hypothetical protein
MEKGRECILDNGLQERVRIMRFAGGNRFGEKEGGNGKQKNRACRERKRDLGGRGGGLQEDG